MSTKVEVHEFTEDQKRWARNVKKRYKGKKDYYLGLIRKQKGLCAFSGAALLFDPKLGTAVKGGKGCHALYAALDHTAADRDDAGHKIVWYALNDIKGHLPHNCFVALRKTRAWKEIIRAWRGKAAKCSDSAQSYALRHQTQPLANA